MKVGVAATRPWVWRQVPGYARRELYRTVFGRHQVDMAMMIFWPSSFVGIGGSILGAPESSYRMPLQASIGTHLMSTWSKNTGIVKHLWACIVLWTRNISKKGRVELDVYDYSKVKARHTEIIPGRKIGKTFTTFQKRGMKMLSWVPVKFMKFSRVVNK